MPGGQDPERGQCPGLGLESRKTVVGQKEEQSSPQPRWALGRRVLSHGLSGCASLALGCVYVSTAVLFPPFPPSPPMASGAARSSSPRSWASGRGSCLTTVGDLCLFPEGQLCPGMVGPHRAATGCGGRCPLRGYGTGEMLVWEPEVKGPSRQGFCQQFPFTEPCTAAYLLLSPAGLREGG